MRFTSPPLVLSALLLAGCGLLPSSSSSDTRVERADPAANFGFVPPDYQLKIVEAFQAKWPAEPLYRYRMELPRRAQIVYSKRNGYAVRFRAQKAAGGAPMADGFPWIAFFENGKIIWVQRASEVGITWFDPAQGTVDWPPSS